MRCQFYPIALAPLALALLLASCGEVSSPDPIAPQTTDAAQPAPTETREYQWDQLLSRDSILPIYDPEFAPANEAGYDDDQLVMGVALEGEAKAYPISVLTGREMVNDELAGTPILVTW